MTGEEGFRNEIVPRCTKGRGWETALKKVIGLIFLLIGVSFPWNALPVTGEKRLELAVGQEQLIPTQGLVRQELIDPSLADLSIGPDGLRVTGKKVGTTVLHVWDDRGRTSYEVVVQAAPPPAEDLATRIREALAAEELLAGEQIAVEVIEGEAVLRGTVSSMAVVERAEEIARRYAEKVRNELRVPPLPSLEERIRRRIRDETGAQVQVLSRNGTIVLEGEVASLAVQRRAEAIARALSPGRVVSHLRVREEERPQIEVTVLQNVPVIGAPMWPQPIRVAVNSSELIRVPGQLIRVAIATDEIAEPVPIPPQEVLINGKKEGQTNLYLWYRPDPFLPEEKLMGYQVEVYSPYPTLPPVTAPGVERPPTAPAPPVEVAPPAPTWTAEKREELQHNIEAALMEVGVSGVRVMIVPREETVSVVIHGEVRTEEDKTRAEQLASAYAPGENQVVNLIRVIPPPAPPPPTPVMEAEVEPPLEEQAARLEAAIAELGIDGVRVDIIRNEDGGHNVRLYGEVATALDRINAETVAHFYYSSGLDQIYNQIEVQMLPPEPPLKEVAPPGVPAPPEEVPAVPVAEVPPAVPPEKRRPIEERFAEVNPFPQSVYLETVGNTVRVKGLVPFDRDREQVVSLVEELLTPEQTVDDSRLVVKPPQILTEVMFLEMGESDFEQLGIEYGTVISLFGAGAPGAPGAAVGAGAGVGPSQVIPGQAVLGEPWPGATFGRVDPLGMRVQMLIQEGKARTLQRPNITVNSGESAYINVGERIPLPEVTAAVGAAVQAVRYEEVGIMLDVTPEVIAGSNLIQMTMIAEVSAPDYSAAVMVAGTLVPVITTRIAETVLTVHSGQTIVLGGLISEEERKNIRRIPFLSEIPILGELFKYRETRTERTTLAVVLRPRILPLVPLLPQPSPGAGQGVGVSGPPLEVGTTSEVPLPPERSGSLGP